LNLLSEQPLPPSLATNRSEEHTVVYRGRDPSDAAVPSTLTLVGADLQDAATMNDILSHIVHPHIPTLVLCELVLAYLQPDACENLLSLVHEKLVRTPGSCLMLYEPLGPVERETKGSVESVLDSYQRAYSNMFNDKLKRGQAVGNAGDDCANTLFHPLAATCQDSRQRLKRLGFTHVHADTAGRVVSHLGIDWTAHDLFDEHAALALYLQSYSFVCAFAEGPVVQESQADSGKALPTSDACDMQLLREYLCAEWTRKDGLLLTPRHRRMCTKSNENAWVTTIAKRDEAQVHRLFSESYKGLSESYGSIRKMVKSALRTDLGVADADLSEKGRLQSMDDVSCIARRYWDMGGDFIVAVQLRGNNRESVESRDASCNPCRRVMGAIGIRRWTNKECSSRSISGARHIVFEIQRFFVDKECRGHGVGTMLFDTLVERLRNRYQPSRLKWPRPEVRIVATTSTILAQANDFYLSKQFEVESSVDTGELTLRTYALTLSPDDKDCR
jgi:GNAT superfamily N-acetyltransferase